MEGGRAGLARVRVDGAVRLAVVAEAAEAEFVGAEAAFVAVLDSSKSCVWFEEGGGGVRLGVDQGWDTIHTNNICNLHSKQAPNRTHKTLPPI